MPGYYIEKIEQASNTYPLKYDTIYCRIDNFHLVNQLGHPITSDNLKDKIVLLHFFCVGCNSHTAEITQNLSRLQRAFENNDSSFLILSITTHPDRDSVTALKRYADKYQVDEDKWWFLTGDTSQIKSIINEIASSDTSVDENGEPADLTNGDQWVLLDKHQYVRGYFNGLDSADIKHCMNDIGLLMLEREKR
jgi:protein SCO1